MIYSSVPIISANIGLFLLFIVFIGYPLFLKIISFQKKTADSNNNETSEFSKENSEVSLTVIIPFFNELSVIKPKLESIKINISDYKKFRVIIVNDGNKEYEINNISRFVELSKFNFEIKIIKLSKQYGKSFAQYAASLKTDTEYILLTDSNSLFDENYFSNILTFLLKKEELFGGCLKYNTDASPEKKYWNIESKLKFAEQDAGLYNTGLFGSNIIIKRELYLDFPYYTLCDFSLPLYYQNTTGKRVYLKKELIVYENDSGRLIESLKSKKRIIHRAMFGLYKMVRMSNKLNKKLLLQILFHKVFRWLSWVMVISVMPMVYFTIKNIHITDYNKVLILVIIFLVVLMVGIRKILYITVVLIASAAALIHFMIIPSLNKWKPSDKS